MLYSIMGSKMTPFLIYEAPHGCQRIRYPMGGRVKFRKVNKNCNYSAHFQNIGNFFLHWASLCGVHTCFWYHYNPTWNDWEMSTICRAGIFAQRSPRERDEIMNFELQRKRENMVGCSMPSSAHLELAAHYRETSVLQNQFCYSSIEKIVCAWTISFWIAKTSFQNNAFGRVLFDLFKNKLGQHPSQTQF